MEVLSSRMTEDHGTYEIRMEKWSICQADDPEMEAAYTKKGEYIGSRKDAERLCQKHGILPEKADEKHVVCSIGFCEAEQKWYGWSHRAIYGFGVGSEVKRGDCAYHPTDKDDFLNDMVNFWSDEDRLDVSGKRTEIDGEPGVLVSWTYGDNIPNEALRGETNSMFSAYPREWGRGEWVAETLEDARQMAVDFAEGVS